MQKAQIRPLIEKNKDVLMALLSRNLSPDTSQVQLEAIIDQEIFNLEYLTVFKPELLECIEDSFENAFRQMIVQNLSFDKDLDLLFVIKRRVTVEDKEFYVVESKPTVNGKISFAKQMGVLLDLGEQKIVEDPVTGLITEITISLITPKYDAGGNVIGESVLPFKFTEKDFKLWQKKSHMLKVSRQNPGNSKTLNFSGENYWNYAPNGIGVNGKEIVGNPSPDNPGGINPSFAITKCVRHALSRAKLERNPYARKFMTNVVHRQYFDSKNEDTEVVLYDFNSRPNIPPLPEEVIHPAEVQNPEPVEVKKEDPVEVQKEEQTEVQTIAQSQILAEINATKTKSEALAVYMKYKDEINKDDIFKKKISQIGASKPEVAPTEDETLNLNDL